MIDWGDAGIGHPFGTLLVTLRSLAHGLGCTLDDARLRPVVDAYLSSWGDPDALRPLAAGVTGITRATVRTRC